MPAIILISTHWNYSNGGINSFNYDLTLNLGRLSKALNIRIACLCYQDPLAYQLKEATDNNVEIISLNKSDSDLNLEEDLSNIITEIDKFRKEDFLYFVGHDIFTGDLSNYLKTHYRESSSIVFHHMDYESYYAIKGNSTPSHLITKFSKQTRILNNSDLVIAVGPKLFDSAKSKTKTVVKQIIPGLQLIDKWETNDNRLRAITFGRYDERTDRLKQMGVAVQAFSDYMNFENEKSKNDATLKVVGIDSAEEAASLINQNTQRNKRYLNILPLPYSPNRKELLETISKSNLCFMLSVHEGFGLAGYESIAASVPLILSKNSGLFQFLNTLLANKKLQNFGVYPVEIGGSADGAINDLDLKQVITGIKIIRAKKKQFDTGIEKLREILLKKYTWEDTANSFIKVLNDAKKVSTHLKKRKNIERALNVNDTEIRNLLRQKYISLPVQNLDYTDRKLLDRSLQKLITNGRFTLLTGDHGIGKSSIVRNYVSKFVGNYQTIAWINFQINIKHSLILSIFKQLNPDALSANSNLDIDDLFQRLMILLNELPGRKLLVIDNLDEFDELRKLQNELQLYEWQIMVTTTKDPSSIPESRKLKVGLMNYSEGYNLFQTISASKLINKSTFRQLFLKHELSPFYIEYFAYAFKKQILLDHSGIKELKVKIPDGDIQTQYRFFVNKMSLTNFLTHIFKTEASSFSKQDIDFLIIYSLLPSNYSEKEIIFEMLSTTFSMQQANEQLNRFIEMGWLSRNLKIHFLRQEILLRNLKPKLVIVNRILKILNKRLEIDSSESPIIKLKYLPIAYSLIGKIKRVGMNSLIHKMGIIEFDYGNLEKAFELQTSIEQSDLDPLLLGSVLFEIGLIQERKGNYELSIDYLLKSLKLRSDNTIEKVNSLSKLSVVYHKQSFRDPGKKYQRKVIKYYKEAIDLLETIIAKKIIPANKPDVGTVYVDSGVVLSEFKTYQEIANQLFIKGINIYEATLPPLHPWLATTYNLYGNYLVQHNIALAIEFIDRSIKIRETIYDNNLHFSLAEGYHDYAYAMLKSNNLGEAKKFIDKAIPIRQKIFARNDGHIHPTLNSSLRLNETIKEALANASQRHSAG